MNPSRQSQPRLRFRFFFALLFVLPLAGCLDLLADAATAIADDIEAQTAAFVRSGSERATFVHLPKPHRGGCQDNYRVQFTRASALVVWCRSAGNPTQSISSHSTTHHLRFVEVPETIIVDKKRGDPLSLEVIKAPGKPILKRVW